MQQIKIFKSVESEVSTLEKEMRVAVKGLKKTEAAEKIGTALAERCLKKEIQKVVDRLTEWGYGVHRSTGETRTVATFFRIRSLASIPTPSQTLVASSGHAVNTTCRSSEPFEGPGVDRGSARRPVAV